MNKKSERQISTDLDSHTLENFPVLNDDHPAKKRKSFINFSTLGEHAIFKLFKNNQATITLQM